MIYLQNFNPDLSKHSFVEFFISSHTHPVKILVCKGTTYTEEEIYSCADLHEHFGIHKNTDWFQYVYRILMQHPLIRCKILIIEVPADQCVVQHLFDLAEKPTFRYADNLMHVLKDVPFLNQSKASSDDKPQH